MNLIVLEIGRRFSFCKKCHEKKSVKVLMRKKWNNKVRSDIISSLRRTGSCEWERKFRSCVSFSENDFLFFFHSFLFATFQLPFLLLNLHLILNHLQTLLGLQCNCEHKLRRQSSQDWQCSTMRSSHYNENTRYKHWHIENL